VLAEQELAAMIILPLFFSISLAYSSVRSPWNHHHLVVSRPPPSSRKLFSVNSLPSSTPSESVKSPPHIAIVLDGNARYYEKKKGSNRKDSGTHSMIDSNNNNFGIIKALANRPDLMHADGAMAAYKLMMEIVKDPMFDTLERLVLVSLECGRNPA